jgi:hypothetical protein
MYITTLAAGRNPNSHTSLGHQTPAGPLEKLVVLRADG